jgi:hypothetical protein
MQNCTAAGKAPSPTIHLQPCARVENNHPTIYATTCPPVTNRLDTTTNRPRNALGASSLIYMGTTKLALPTAAPTILLPAIMPGTVFENACISAPTTNNTSARKMIPLRPNASARTPVTGDASSAKNDVDDVIRLLSSVESVRCDKSELIETSVEEITPVLGEESAHRPCRA